MRENQMYLYVLFAKLKSKIRARSKSKLLFMVRKQLRKERFNRAAKMVRKLFFPDVP